MVRLGKRIPNPQAELWRLKRIYEHPLSKEESFLWNHPDKKSIAVPFRRIISQLLWLAVNLGKGNGFKIVDGKKKLVGARIGPFIRGRKKKK